MTADRSFAASNKEFADVNKEGFLTLPDVVAKGGVIISVNKEGSHDAKCAYRS
jgi:hypothetical protein